MIASIAKLIVWTEILLKKMENNHVPTIDELSELAQLADEVGQYMADLTKLL